MHFTIPRSVIRLLVKSQSGNAHDEIRRLSLKLREGNSESEKASLKSLVEMRRQLEKNDQEISFEDFGKTQSRDSAPKSVKKTRTISDIYQRASIPKTWSEFLFDLVRFMKPSKVLEIGTNIGVGACYLQKALDLNGEGKLYSLEGSTSLSNFAEGQLDKYCSGKVALITGPFSTSLPQLLSNESSFSMVFIDGHHTEEATLNYYRLIKPHLTRPALMIFDDIEPWSPVKKAWTRILEQETAELSNFDAIYLFKKGLVYFH